MSVGPFGPGGSVIAYAPGASMSVEAAFAQFAPAGGSVVSFAPGASMTTEAAFAPYAPAGGSLGLNAPNGCSIGVEAAFHNALQSGLFNGSSLGVEAAFFNGSSLGVEAAFSSVAPVGGSLNLPGYLGFDGCSLGVEAAFLEHGPRNPSGASCMTGAGASMAVEGAFSEFAPPLGLSLVTSAAPDVPFTNGIMEDILTPQRLADIMLPPPVLPSRQVPPSVPRRLAPLASQTQPDFVRAQPPVVRQRQGDNASFRSAAPPPVVQYSHPAVRQAVSSAQMEGSFNDIATGRSLQPPLMAEVLNYPQMYPTSNIRQEAIARDGPAFTERVSSIPGPTPFDRYAHSYTGPGVVASLVRDRPSYIPRPATAQGLSLQHYLNEGDRPSYIPRPATSPGLSVQHYLCEGDVPSYIPRPVMGQGLSLQQMPAQGLSLQLLPPGSGVAYPGPVPQRNPSLLSSPFVAQPPITIESTPAMFQQAPSMARAPQRGNSSNFQPFGMQYFNGNTARYAPPMQSTAPAPSFLSAPALGSLMPNMSPSPYQNPSPYQIPNATYIKPSFIPNQAPSFTAPVMGANQVPPYTSPQLQQALTGQMPIQYSRPVVAMPM